MSATDSPLVRVDNRTYRDLVEGSRLVLLHFRADWCGPCNSAVEPVLEDLAGRYGDDLVVAEVDAESGQDAIDAFEVDTLLTTVLLVDGEEVERFRGKTPYPVFERAIDPYVNR